MEGKARILVVDDHPEIRQAVQVTLRGRGYEFRTAVDGRTGLTSAFSDPPDLIVLDVHMPEMDGIEACRRLKASLVTRHVPILILTSGDGSDLLVQALEAGADDYVRKPFDPRELQARVAMLLRRTAGYVGTDPLTKLPGNRLLRDELARRLSAGDDLAVLYVDLDNFKAYVDHYGFEPASRVIQETARTCYNEMVEWGTPDDFIGHIGGDDFVIVTSPEQAQAVCEGIIDSFEAARVKFYSADDLARGWFRGLNRDNEEQDFPLMTITIPVLLPGLKHLEDLDALAVEAARCKRLLKALDGSNWRVFEE